MRRGEDLFEREMTALWERIQTLQGQAGGDAAVAEWVVEDLQVAHEELRVAAEEVRVQQEELYCAQRLQRRNRDVRERLVSLLPVAVLGTDEKGLIHAANAAASMLLGIRVDQLLRKPLFVLVDPDQHAALRQQLRYASRSTASFRRVVTLRPVHARPIEVEVQVTVFQDPDTGARDVTWLLLSTHGADTRELSESGTRGGLARALAELTQLPGTEADRHDVLARAARICARALGPGASVSLTVGPITAPELVVTSDKSAQLVDGAQMTAAQGPCAQAWETARAVWSPDLHHDGRWQRLARHLQATNVNGVIALPFGTGEKPVGTLNVYRAAGAPVDAQLAEAVHLLSGAVAAIVHEMDVRTELENLTGQLRAALVSRATIDQAKGIVMAHRHCTPEEAFDHLRDLSSHTNVKLRDIAAHLVQTAQAPPPPPP